MEPASPPPFAAGFELPEEQERQLDLPLAGLLGTGRLVAAGGPVLSETRFVAERPAPAWQHLNERPVVEMNFMLAGTLRQSQSGLLRGQLYAQNTSATHRGSSRASRALPASSVSGSGAGMRAAERIW